MDDLDDTLTNLAKPLSSATITVRVVKSFQYRVAKALVINDLDLTNTTVGDLKERVKKAIQTQAGWKPYKSLQLDTLKLYTKAHGAKTTNLIINLENDEWILDDDTATLATVGFENETEVSFFNRSDYDGFKASPEIKWD
ncbi:hypothetical protein M408DRAFT_329318 [Serendipita vermifera MAFF 305830]|uniref:Cytoplasmic protein n=1 Tax=Serendipita vermifera MAFF 305830 TaxID=933852 RepID=A0A0C3B9V0_SERVB|nr:hypothetical protein M408DRAFT_329318 [Serendipita vermifera MAFF 305830]